MLGRTRRVAADTCSAISGNLTSHITTHATRVSAQPTSATISASPYTMDIQLSKLIRRKIVVLGPALFDNGNNDPKLQTVTLVGVEPAGIWIESEEALNRIADRFRVKPAAPTALFIPFTQITTLLASIDSAAATDSSPASADAAA